MISDLYLALEFWVDHLGDQAKGHDPPPPHPSIKVLPGSSLFRGKENISF